MNTNIRFVRCPKCRLVLPEPAESPVYQCGGCGALLEAKNRKTDANDGATSNIVQTGPAPKPTLEHASEEDIVATNLNQQSTTVSSEQAEKEQYDSTDSGTEKPSCINHSEEARSSTDISSHENPESSPEARALMDSDTETCDPDQDDRSDSNKEQPVGINMPDGIYSSLSPEPNYHPDSKSPSAQIEVDEENVKDRDELEDSSRELPYELTSHEVEESAQETVLDTEVEENLMKGTALRSLISEKLMDSRPRKLASTSQNLVDEDVERSHSNKFQGFVHTGFAKTLEGTSFNKPRRDLGSSYCSVSSFDGNHDQIADSHLISRRRNCVVRSKELPKGDVVRGKLGRSQNEMNRGQWPHEFPGPMGQALKGDDARSRVPFHERGSRTSHGDASTSSLGFSEFQYNSTYHSPVKSDDPESEKLELLRMVHQLQDQLNRTKLLIGNPSGGYPDRVAMKEKQMPPYYHLAAEREMHQDLNYSRYPVQYGQGKSWSHQFKPSRTAFSGETLHNRGQIDCSCFRCYPQDRHYSAQLPPRDIYPSKDLNGTQYSPYQSGPTSPQHHNGSEYSLWSYETRANDQWHRKDHRDMKTRQLPKRHFRPLVGGSPMVACYLCTETLQLPADFLVFRRRYHSLKCNACSKVLKFSLRNRNNLVPYVPESVTIAPPPSEVDEYTDPKKDRIFKSESVSYSDDYGGVYKDYSAETDASSIPTPFDRKMTSVSSSDPTVDRKKRSVQSSGPGKFSSKKMSSEIEDSSATSSSPLHLLMGYASPSRVLRGEAD